MCSYAMGLFDALPEPSKRRAEADDEQSAKRAKLEGERARNFLASLALQLSTHRVASQDVLSTILNRDATALEPGALSGPGW